MKKFLFIAAFLAICGFMSSCAIKANSDDVVLVVKDVLTSENGSVITFRNSDRILHADFKPLLSSGEVLLVKPDGQYVILSENNHFDFVMVLVMVILAFFAGCLITGRYTRRCLADDEDKNYFG